MSKEIERIARMLQKTFDQHPWYGPPVMEILKQVDASIADKRIGAVHTINELIMHMISWRLFATKRLSGDDLFQIDDKINFPKPGSWNDSLTELQKSQNDLVKAVKNFPEEKLSDICPSKVHKYTYYTLLHGIIQHDVYHLGQIALLKKAFGD
jgi:uncharacterized damage-inducible protein DinB